MLMALCNCINTYLSFFGIEAPVVSYIGSVSFLDWIYIYLSAIVFDFCLYHRMFLYYVLMNNLLSIYEFHIGLPVEDAGVLRLFSFLTGGALFIILVLYLRKRNASGRKESTATGD